MVKSSTLTEEPLVEGINHADTVCTVGVTNFNVCLNPAGMVLVASIDPTALFINRYSHTLWCASAMHHARIGPYDLNTIKGFMRLYGWLLNDQESKHYGSYLFVNGFPYEVDVKESSPLVGWFNVMKGVSDGR